MTATRNPGIIPRNSRPSNSGSTSTSIASLIVSSKLPTMRDVYVNGRTVKVRFCPTCLLYRPPRTSHCSVCNNCIQRFDQHCPWVGQCVGARNYRTFVLLVTTSTILCIYIITFSLLHLLHEPGTVWSKMSRDIVSVILIVYCFVSAVFVGALSFYHFYLMCTNQTTYEKFRYHYSKNDNPYNRGIVNNLKEILFSKTTPSLVDFRQMVYEEDGFSNAGSVNRKYFGNDVIKLNEKMDLEIGLLNKGDKQLTNLVCNDVDYSWRDGSLNKGKGGNCILDSVFFWKDREVKCATEDSVIDDHRTSSRVLLR